jgi:hypothetical protein
VEWLKAKALSSSPSTEKTKRKKESKKEEKKPRGRNVLLFFVLLTHQICTSPVCEVCQ